MEVFVDKQQKKKEFEHLGVHDLRHLARNLGVSRPTMKIKEELLDEIASILVGETPVGQAGVRGRKATVKLAEFGAVDFVLPPSLQMLVKKRQFGQINGQFDTNTLTLSQNVVSNLVEVGVREGYLEAEENDHYFWDLNTEKMVYVNNALVDGYALKVGDRVVAKCAESPAFSFSVAREITLVNFSAPPSSRSFCSFKADVVQKNASHFAYKNLSEGEAVLICEKLSGKVLDDAAETLKKFSENGFKIVGLGTSVSEEFYGLVKAKIDAEEAVAFLSASQHSSLQRVRNVIQNMVLRVASGEKIVLLILDAKRLLEDVVYCMKVDSPVFASGGFDDKRFLNYIASFKRILKNGGSLTIMSFNS